MSASIEYSDNKTVDWYVELNDMANCLEEVHQNCDSVQCRLAELSPRQLNDIPEHMHSLWDRATPAERQLILVSVNYKGGM